MKYLDSNVFIYSVIDNGPKGDVARDIISETITSGNATINCLTIDEVIWGLWRFTKDRNMAVRYGSMLFAMAGLRILPVSPNDVYYGLSMMRKYPKLRPRDSLHLSTAIRAGANIIVSDDKDFDNLGEIKREGLDS